MNNAISELRERRTGLIDREKVLTEDLYRVRGDIVRSKALAGKKILEGANPGKLSGEISNLNEQEALINGALELSKGNLKQVTEELERLENDVIKTDLLALRAGQKEEVSRILDGLKTFRSQVDAFVDQEFKIIDKASTLHPGKIDRSSVSSDAQVIIKLQSMFNQYFDVLRTYHPDLLGIRVPTQREKQISEAEYNVERMTNRIDQLNAIDKNARGLDWEKNMETAKRNLSHAKERLKDFG